MTGEIIDNTITKPLQVQKGIGSCLYSQLSLRRTPLGPAVSVRLREVSVL